jgi:hypothetical protein
MIGGKSVSCHFMHHMSHVDDTGIKRGLNLGLHDVKLENKCLKLWHSQARNGGKVMAGGALSAL